MRLSLSTRWNAGRHSDGGELIDEILALGFDAVELGYDLTADLVPGVKRRIDERAVTVTSVHNFCPVPPGAPHGHPELFQLADRSPRASGNAVRHTLQTAQFAAEMGARLVVVHAGSVRMRPSTRQLLALCERGKRYSPKYERLRMRLILNRERKGGRHLDALKRAIDALLPDIQPTGTRLCFENLPYWEAVPSESETLDLLRAYNSPHLGYWHDVGHGQVRQNLGFVDAPHWLRKLGDWLGGLHLHDVMPPACDHLMPPRGEVDFAPIRDAAGPDAVCVLEPAPGTPPDEVAAAREFVLRTWAAAPGGNANAATRSSEGGRA